MEQKGALNFKVIKEKRIPEIEEILNELVAKGLGGEELSVFEKRLSYWIEQFKDAPDYRPALGIYCSVYNRIAEKLNRELCRSSVVENEEGL